MIKQKLILLSLFAAIILLLLGLLKISLPFNNAKSFTQTKTPFHTFSKRIKVSNVAVADFMSGSVDMSNSDVQGDRRLANTSDYQIVFLKDFNEFLIVIQATPFDTIRQEAEQALLGKLAVSQDDACKLKVTESVSSNLDIDQADRKFGLSFCEGDGSGGSQSTAACNPYWNEGQDGANFSDPTSCSKACKCQNGSYCTDAQDTAQYKQYCLDHQTQKSQNLSTNSNTGDCTVTERRDPQQGDYCYDTNNWVHYCYDANGKGRVGGSGSCGDGNSCQGGTVGSGQAGQCVTGVANSSGTTGQNGSDPNPYNCNGRGSTDCAASPREQYCVFDSGACRGKYSTPAGYGCDSNEVCTSGSCYEGACQ